MHSHAGVAEHRLGTRRLNVELLLRVGELVPEATPPKTRKTKRVIVKRLILNTCGTICLQNAAPVDGPELRNSYRLMGFKQ